MILYEVSDHQLLVSASGCDLVPPPLLFPHRKDGFFQRVITLNQLESRLDTHAVDVHTLRVQLRKPAQQNVLDTFLLLSKASLQRREQRIWGRYNYRIVRKYKSKTHNRRYWENRRYIKWSVSFSLCCAQDITC